MRSIWTLHVQLFSNATVASQIISSHPIYRRSFFEKIKRSAMPVPEFSSVIFTNSCFLLQKGTSSKKTRLLRQNFNEKIYPMTVWKILLIYTVYTVHVGPIGAYICRQSRPSEHVHYEHTRRAYMQALYDIEHWNIL